MRVGKHIWKHKANLDPKDANQCVLPSLWRGNFRIVLKHSTLWSWSIKPKHLKLNFLPIPWFISQKWFLAVIFSLYFIWPQLFSLSLYKQFVDLDLPFIIQTLICFQRNTHRFICNRVRNINPLMQSRMYSTCAYNRCKDILKRNRTFSKKFYHK